MIKRYLSLLSFGMVIFLAGCTTSTPETEGENQAAQATQESSGSVSKSDASEIETANQKLGHYVDCINNHSNRALDSYDRYLMWANEETGPTGNEQNIYGLYKLTFDPQECANGIAEATKMKPTYTELDSAATAYSSALTTLAPLIDEANEYYEEKNYQDDAMAKGKEMHPKLIGAFKAFAEADKTMRSELEMITDELDAKQLALLEKTEGRKYPFLTKNVMILAKRVLNEGDVNNLEEVNAGEMQKEIELYESAIDELKTYNTTHKDELGPGIGVDSFLGDANEFLVSAKSLMRRARDKTGFETGESMLIESGSAEMVEGTPANLVEKYNDLIDTHNFMRI